MFCDMYLSGCWKEMNQGFPRRCQIQGEAAKATVDFFYSAKQRWLLLHYYAVYIKIKDSGVVAFCYLSLWLNVSDKMFFHKTSFILLVDISTIILCLQIILK